MTSRSYDQPVQLRIGFGQPSRPITLVLGLAGLIVSVDEAAGRLDEAGQYLTSVGITVTTSDIRGMTFPAVQLSHLTNLPDQVEVRCDEALAPLWKLVCAPSEGGLPATMSLDQFGELRLAWFDGTSAFDERFDPDAATILLASDLSFVATPDAWKVLESSTSMPVLTGRARVNLDGYVEISTSRPQMVEASPLPGLFRIDETHFGVALKYASSVGSAPGFVWDGPRPSLERGPSHLPELPVELSSHHQNDLRDLVDHLAAYRAQAIVWDSGLGRRVFTLAAVATLDAWPLLIVCPPANVWVWQRHLDLFERSAALTHQRADAHVITYRDLARRRELISPQAVIFDDLPSTDADLARAATHRFDGLLDSYRIATSSVWPTDLTDAVALMSVLRPGEFRADVPLASRYPGNPSGRALEHVEAYLSRRSLLDADTDRTVFRRSSSIVVTASDAQLRALELLKTRKATMAPEAQLAEMLEIISAGPTTAISPKVAAAAGRARDAAIAGHRVALVTRHRRTATLLRAALRGTPGVTAVVVDGSNSPGEHPDANVVVVHFDRTLGDLRSFDVVVVVDYPWSAQTLERAVGGAGDDQGPLEVLVVHAEGTVDDRVALLAAYRRELAAVVDPDAAPDAEDIEWLLADRWPSPVA